MKKTHGSSFFNVSGCSKDSLKNRTLTFGHWRKSKAKTTLKHSWSIERKVLSQRKKNSRQVRGTCKLSDCLPGVKKQLKTPKKSHGLSCRLTPLAQAYRYRQLIDCSKQTQSQIASLKSLVRVPAVDPVPRLPDNCPAHTHLTDDNDLWSLESFTIESDLVEAFREALRKNWSPRMDWLSKETTAPAEQSESIESPRLEEVTDDFPAISGIKPRDDSLVSAIEDFMQSSRDSSSFPALPKTMLWGLGIQT